MKKFLACLLLVCCVFVLFGCQPQEPFKEPNGQTNEIPKEPITTISTKANFTFFPTEKNDLHQDELKEAYQRYVINLDEYGDYEIFNLLTEDISKKYDLDIFQVSFSTSNFYYVKHADEIYVISPFVLKKERSCINHVAITDINDDGYVEILTSIYNGWTVGTSYVQITDTNTKKSVDIIAYDKLCYFKENEAGVISIYDTAGQYPVAEDLQNGKLAESYYEFANNLFDTPQLNTATYDFKRRFLKTSCDLFEVEITIEDNSIKFPYLIKSTYTPISFSVNAKMTWWGESFDYWRGDGYFAGATVSFVCGDSEILSEGVGAADVVSRFWVSTGQEIERSYDYNDSFDHLNEVGVYDMVIKYWKVANPIVIEDFLEIRRY